VGKRSEHFLNEEVQMASKYPKSAQHTYHQEMRIEPTPRFHLTTIRMAIIPKKKEKTTKPTTQMLVRMEGENTVGGNVN
jgi:hypothetical protein